MLSPMSAALPESCWLRGCWLFRAIPALHDCWLFSPYTSPVFLLIVSPYTSPSWLLIVFALYKPCMLVDCFDLYQPFMIVGCFRPIQALYACWLFRPIPADLLAANTEWAARHLVFAFFALFALCPFALFRHDSFFLNIFVIFFLFCP